LPTEGNDAETVARFADHIDDHNSDASRIKEVCIDETAAKRGHDYVSLFADIDARKIVYVSEGRSTAGKFLRNSTRADNMIGARS
jgi:Transposase